MTILLALASALLVGGADYLGGVTARRVSIVRLAAAAQLAGLVVALPAALVIASDRVSGADAAWSLASGLALGVGIAVFYAALARGTISIVAPVTAVVGALVPVVYALARGERPGTAALAGIALAVAAIALVSIARQEDGAGPRGLGLAVLAGALFGVFYVSLSRTHDDAGLWPVALSRVGSGATLLVAALVLTRGLDPGRSAWRPVVAIAVLEVFATVTLLLALQRGPVSVASVVASLYPVTTTFLAALLLRERLQRSQRLGVLLALAAIVLISSG